MRTYTSTNRLSFDSTTRIVCVPSTEDSETRSARLKQQWMVTYFLALVVHWNFAIFATVNWPQKKWSVQKISRVSAWTQSNCRLFIDFHFDRFNGIKSQVICLMAIVRWNHFRPFLIPMRILPCTVWWWCSNWKCSHLWLTSICSVI